MKDSAREDELFLEKRSAQELDLWVVELLSKGLVLEWETESLIDDYQKLSDAEGVPERAAKVVDKSEAELLETIGNSAGVGNDRSAISSSALRRSPASRAAPLAVRIATSS